MIMERGPVMLQSDPIKPPARHATPRHTLTTALEILAAMAVIAAVAVGMTLANRPASPVTSRFGATVAHAATHAAGRFTPSLAPLTHGHRSRDVHGQYSATRGMSRR